MRDRHPAQGTIDAQDHFEQERLGWAEKKFQAEVMELAKDLGWTLQYHTHSSRFSDYGWPDLVLVRETTNQLVIAELKSERGRMGTKQEQWLGALKAVAAAVRNHHVGVYLWRPSDWDEIHEVLR